MDSLKKKCLLISTVGVMLCGGFPELLLGLKIIFELRMGTTMALLSLLGIFAVVVLPILWFAFCMYWGVRFFQFLFRPELKGVNLSTSTDMSPRPTNYIHPDGSIEAEYEVVK